MQNDPLSHGLWEMTAPPAPPTVPLKSEIRADVAIVGCGYTGLSAALHLAGAGASVALLEAHAPGWGASGRNGGQVIPGWKDDPETLAARHGAELGLRMRAQASPAAGIQIGVTVHHEQLQLAKTFQDRTQRREFTQVEFTRPVGRHPGYHRGAFGQYARERSVCGQDGCRPGTAGPQIVHVRGRESAAVRTLARFHLSRMP